MAEAPKRAGPTLLGTATATQYTAGAAGTWAILRHIDIANESGVDVTVTVGVGTTNVDAAGKRFLRAVTVRSGETASWRGFLPLFGHATTPDLIYALCSAANGVTATYGLVEGP